MSKLIKDITGLALSNGYFRQVLENGTHTQVVLMSIPAGSEIGEETHSDNDQILFCVAGSGKVILEGVTSDFVKDDLVLVTAGTKHNFLNSGTEDLKIITTYSPPHHPPHTIHKTKSEAELAEY